MGMATMRRTFTGATAGIGAPVCGAAILPVTRLGMRAAVAGPAMAAAVGTVAAAEVAADMPAAADTVAAAEEAAVMATNRRWQGKAMRQPTDGNRRSTAG